VSDPVTTSRSARESLARGLAALQTDPNLPASITNIAEPIAQAMGALHNIERSQGAELSPHAETALGHVRGALSQLQSQPATHPAVANALEAVAASLGLVHQLSKMVQGPAASAVAAPAAAPVAAGIPRPGTQPLSPAMSLPRPQGAQPAAQPVAQPSPQPSPQAIPPQPVIQAAPQPVAQPSPQAIPPQPVIQAASQPVAQPSPQAIPPQPVMQAPPPAQASAAAVATANMGNAATLVAPMVMPQARAVTQPLQPAPAAPMQATMAMPPQQQPPTAPQAFQPPAQEYPTAPQAFQPPGASPIPPGFQPAAQAPQGPPPGFQPAAQAPQGPPPGFQPAAQAPHAFQPVAQAYAPQAAADPFAAPRAPQASADPFAAPKAAPQAPAGGGQVINADLGAHSPTNFYKGLSGNDIVDHGGLFVATYMIPKIGTPVRLRVSLPGGYEFEAGAIVRWARDQAGTSDGSQPGFGAQLTEITSEARQLIYRYVRNREPLFHDDL
jgi:hypothetical protein